jgi:hypothetical protein
MLAGAAGGIVTAALARVAGSAAITLDGAALAVLLDSASDGAVDGGSCFCCCCNNVRVPAAAARGTITVKAIIRTSASLMGQRRAICFVCVFGVCVCVSKGGGRVLPSQPRRAGGAGTLHQMYSFGVSEASQKFFYCNNTAFLSRFTGKNAWIACVKMLEWVIW